MERRAELVRVNKNIRYKMVGDTDRNYYLLDGDYNIGGYLSLMLNWVFPQKFYKVTEEQLKDLEAGEYIDANHSYGSMGSVLALIGAVFGSRILQKVSEKISFSVPVTGRYAILIGAVIVLLILRVWISYSQKKKLAAILDIRSLKVVKARIVPVAITKGHRKFIYVQLICLVFFLMGIIFYIRNDDFTILSMLLLGGVALFFNLLAFSDGEYIMKFEG